MLIARYGHIRSPAAIELLRAPLADTTDKAAPPSPAVRNAMTLYLAGQTNAARTALVTIIDSDPTQAIARTLLGVLAYQQGDITTVRRCIQELQARDKQALPLLLIEARLDAEAGHTDRARQSLARALAFAPRHLPALEALLALELDASDAPNVSPLLQPVLALDPGNALANFGLGVNLYRAGKLDLAEAAFRRSLERRPMPDTLNNLAWLLQARGACDTALALVDEALRLDPADAASWDTRGVTLMQLNRLDEAATALARALELQPDAAESRQHMEQLRQKRETR
jgi:Tfp pilus assembly protein PilF